MSRNDIDIKKPPIWLYIIVVFITQLDGGAVSTLLPSITNTFNLSSLSSSWVAGIYTLGLIIGTPITSNLSDAHGTKPIFLGELIFWFIGCLITATSVNYPVMLLGRFIQAIGDSGIIVLSMNVLLRASKKNKQGRRVSLVGVVAGLSAVIGPIIAGLSLAKNSNWRIFYYILLPVLLILFLLTWHFLGNIKAKKTWETDYLGLSSFTISLMTLMLAITFCQYFKRYWGLILILIIICIISGIIFNRVEKRLPEGKMPFLPLNLFRLRTYSLILLLGTLGGMLFSLFIYIPKYVHAIFGLPLPLSGMVLVGTGLGSVIGSWIGGILVDKFGNKLALTFASSMIGIMGIIISFTLTNLTNFVILSFLLGIGLGSLMSAPLQVIAGRLAGPEEHMQAIGGVSATKKIGTTVAPLLFASAIQIGARQGVVTLTSFRNMFILVIIISIVCVATTSSISFKNIKNKKGENKSNDK